MLGKRYLGKNGIWAICLMAIGGAGMFLILDSAVKQRISDTFERTETLIGTSPHDSALDRPSGMDLDFRIPTALDTFALIADFKWTGVGAGQYYYIFPQVQAPYLGRQQRG